MVREASETRPADRPASIYFAIVVAWLGVLVCLLLIRHGAVGLCAPGSGCDRVLASPYAEPLGVPLSLAGLAFYVLTLVTLLLGVALPEGRARSRVWLALLAVTSLGFGVSTVLMVIQAAVLKAFCPFCAASAVFATVLCALAWRSRNHLRWQRNPCAAAALVAAFAASAWVILHVGDRAAEDETTPAAVVDGYAITRGELDEAMQLTQYDVARQIHEVELERLQERIDDYLLRVEASKRGSTPAALLNTEVIEKAKVSEPALEQWQAATPERRSLDREQARRQLTVEWLEAVRSKFMQTLRAGHDIRILIRPPLPPLLLVDLAKTKIRGRLSAPVELLIYSDFDCPYCREMSVRLAAIEREFPGKVMIAFHYFPLDEHPRSWAAATAAECASEQGKFWEYHDWLFASGGRLSDEDLWRGAQAVGLDLEKFRSCLVSGRAAALVRQRYEEGSAAGVYGTPMLFLNGRLVDPDRYEKLVEVVKEALATKH